MQKLSLSLIIPVYNEERHIKACLDAVAKQTRMPDEVIVVDNNSIDKTAEIASRFDFVKVISEHKQGLIPARNAGFERASGEILGRIDADSVLEADWVERALESFCSDQTVIITGLGFTSLMHYLTRPRSTLFSRLYFWYAEYSFGCKVAWGANMALRKSAWQKAKPYLAQQDNEMHEDQDLSIMVMKTSHTSVKLNKSLLISTDGQTYRYFPKLVYYWKLHQMTKWRHRWSRNLPSERVRYMTKFRTLPKMAMAVPLAALLLITSLLLYPLDLLRAKLS